MNQALGTVMSEKLNAYIIESSKELLLKLERLRSTTKHNSSKGSNVEDAYRHVLRDYLPGHHSVGHGEVIDKNDSISPQVDVIVTNRYHPNFNSESEPGIYLKEGVAVAGEVKTSLATKDFEQIYNTCLNYKKLQVENIEGSMIYSSKGDIKRFINNRGYFVFALESSATLEKIQAYFIDRYHKEQIPYEHQVDAFFILGRGIIINNADCKGSLKAIDHDGNPIKGLFRIDNTDNAWVLSKNLLWLDYAMIDIVGGGGIMGKYISWDN